MLNEANSNHNTFARAFTLLEVLAVAAVIGLLLSLIFPAYNMIAERGKEVQRMNNMRNLATGVLLYAADNGALPNLCQQSTGGWVPPFWYQSIEDYLPDNEIEVTFFNGQTRRVPSVRVCPLVPDGSHVGSDYAGNSNLFLSPQDAPSGVKLRLASIENAAQVVMILTAETRATGNPSWYLNGRYYINHPNSSSNLPTGKWTRQPYVAAVFADGRYDQIPVEDFLENRERYLMPENWPYHPH